MALMEGLDAGTVLCSCSTSENLSVPGRVPLLLIKLDNREPLPAIPAADEDDRSPSSSGPIMVTVGTDDAAMGAVVPGNVGL
jgi:hypothetical protein